MPVKKTTSQSVKKSSAERAVDQMKSAPQKIVEHTLNAALSTVEKAVVQDVKRKAKRVEKSAKKVAVAKQNVFAAKAEERRANGVVQSVASEEKKEKAVAKKTTFKAKIKDKIEQLIRPEKELVFYYDRRQQVALLLIYAIIALVVYGIAEGLKFYPQCCYPFLMTMLMITKGLIMLALVLTLMVVIFRPVLAVVNKDGIKIDHNETLSWDDVETAEEKYTSYLMRRPLIALHVTPENLKKYHLTFMQVLCKGNVFTPFSIPMYAMRPEDAEAIRKAIKKHAKYEDNRN